MGRRAGEANCLVGLEQVQLLVISSSLEQEGPGADQGLSGRRVHLERECELCRGRSGLGVAVRAHRRDEQLDAWRGAGFRV